MKTFARIALAAVLATSVALPPTLAWSQEKPKKNWTAPAKKIYGQQLVDETMKKHPELLSVTLHGVPPGEKETYTMFAGSFPERIGNPDDPDDIDVSKKGITILDPRWHRTKDTDKKFVVLMPMRDKANENVGLVVYAFKNPKYTGSAGEKYYLEQSIKLRDELAKKISSYDALFQPAK